MKLVGIIIAIICLVAAIYTFDLRSFNNCVVSVLLVLSAAMTLVNDEKINKILRKTAWFTLAFLLLKMILFG